MRCTTNSSDAIVFVLVISGDCEMLIEQLRASRDSCHVVRLLSLVILEPSSQVSKQLFVSDRGCGGRDDREFGEGFNRLRVLQLELPSSMFLLGDAVHVTYDRIGADM